MAGMYEQLLKQAEEKPSAYKSLLQQANSAAEEKKQRNAAIAAAYSDIINGASSSPGKGTRTADVVDSLGTTQPTSAAGIGADLLRPPTQNIPIFWQGGTLAGYKGYTDFDPKNVTAHLQSVLPLEETTKMAALDKEAKAIAERIEDLQGQYDDVERKVQMYSTSSDPKEQAMLGAAQTEMANLQDQINKAEAEYTRVNETERNNYYMERDLKEVGTWSQDEIDGAKAYFSTGRASAIPQSLMDRYGETRLVELLESYRRVYNQEKSQEYTAAGEKLGENLGFLGIVPQVGGSLLSAAGNVLDFLGAGGSEARNGTGRYKGADPYRPGTWLSDWSSGVGKGAAKKAPEQILDLLELAGQANPYSTEMGNFNATPRNYTPQLYEASRGTRAGEVIDAVGPVAYNATATAADAVARAYLGGAIFGPGTTAAKAFSLGLSGVKSYNDTFNDVLRKGGNDGQAVVLGLFNAGTEVATEYLPLEEWWKVAENGVDGVVPLLKEAVRQGALEASQEEIGFLATSLAEYAELREKSEYQVLKRELMAQGYSEEQAERMMWEEFGKQAAGVAVTSFFSGGLSEVGAAAFHSLMPGAVTTQTQEQTETQEAQPSAAPAPQTQEQSQEAVPTAETVPQAQTPLQKAQDYYRQNGTVSNSLARAILADSDSIAVLREQADLQLGYTDSQRRNDVKAAVARPTGAAETSQSAATDLSESIADSIAETQAETQQTVRETEQSGDADGAVGAETYRQDQAEKPQWEVDNENGIRQVLEDIENGATRNMLYAKAQSYAAERAQIQKNKPYGEPYTEAEMDRMRSLDFLESLYAGAARNPKGTVTMYKPLLEDIESGADPEMYRYDMKNGRTELPPVEDDAKAQDAEQSGNVDEAIGSALRGEQPKVQTVAQTQQQTAPAAQEVQEQGQNAEAVQTEQQSQPQQTDMEHGAVGAAEAGFTGKGTYYDQYGEKPARAGDDQSGRLVQVPERDAQGRHVTDFTSNAMGAQITSNDMAEAIEDMVEIGALSFDRQTNQKAVEDAAAEIKKLGWAKARDRVRDHAFAGQSKDGEIAQAMLLYAHYNKVGDIDNASEMMVVLSTMANRAGRDLQLFSMFRKLTPEGKLMTLQKTIDRAIDKMNQNRGKRNQQGEIVISNELRQMYTDLAKIAGDSKLAAADQAAVDIGSHLEEDKAQAAETAVSKAARRPRAKNTENAKAQKNEPLTEVEKMGEKVANRVKSLATANDQSQEETLFSEIMRIVNENIPEDYKKSGAKPANTNLKALAEYYRSIPFFPEVWTDARKRVLAEIQKLPDGSAKRAVLEDIYDRSSEALTLKGPEDPNSVARKAAGEAAKMAGIRMENATQRTEQAKAEMRDVLTQNAASKAEAARRIADIAVSSMGLDGDAAQEMAETITDAFYADLAQRGAARVQQLLTPKAVPEKVVKSIAQRLGELYNMGAFQDAQTRQAVMDTVFGEGSGVDVPDSLLETFVNAANDNLWDAEEAIYKWAGSQMRGTFADKCRAWRYMAMLGNAKTQVRNLAGNTAFVPMKAAKDAIGAAFELFLDKDKRTKAVINLANQNDRELMAWAKADAKSRPVARAMQYSARMGDDVSQGIMMENKRVFNWDALENVRKFVQKVPGVADMLFKNGYYQASLAGFLKARGYTAEQVRSGQVSQEVLTEGRTYAINEAMKATFNDSNAFSDAVAAIGRGNRKNWFGKVFGAAAEGELPFRRTLANIVVRFVEYSPIGLVTTGAKAIQGVVNGNYSAASMIDGLASSFTGTALAVLGAAMAHGIFPFKLHGGVEDEDDKRRGVQSWSVEYERDGKTYTYTVDWAAPANLPLFFGAQLYEAFTEDSEETKDFSAFTKFIYACGTAFEPMLELSCLSGINDLLESRKYIQDGSALSSVAVNIAMSYFMQFIPAAFRQAYQVTQQNKMTTFANSEDPLIRGIQREASGLPFLGAMFQTEKLTPWGEEISRGSLGRRAFDAFLNPGTEMEVDTSALEDEISRLNSLLPDDVSPPDLPDKTLTYTDKEGKVHEDYRLTEEEWQTMARTQGQTERAMLEEIVDSDAYANMTDAQKGEVFKMVYEYAKLKARDEAVEDYVADYSKWMKDLQENGVEAIYRWMTTSDLTGGISDWLNAPSADIRGESLTEVSDALAVYDGMSESEKTAMRDAAGGRAKYLLLAHDEGMDPEKFLELYEQYSALDDNKLMNATGKTEAWGLYLQRKQASGEITREQELVLRENMLFFSNTPGSSKKLDEMQGANLGADTIEAVIGGIDLLEPLPGNSGVTDYQVRERVMQIAEDENLSDREIDIVMKTYMTDYNPNSKNPDKTELKYDEIRGRGYTPGEYFDLYSIYVTQDQIGGKGTKDRTIGMFKDYLVDNGMKKRDAEKQAELLYSILGGDYYKK